MTSADLAGWSNTAVYSAMAVLTLAFLAYAAYLAFGVPGRESAEVPEAELVSVGAPGAAATRSGSTPTTPASPVGDREPIRARKAAGIARALTVLSTVLLLGGIVARAASVRRWPLGNMYEFALVGSFFVLVAFLAWGSRRDLRWLGVFVVGPALLTLGLAITVWYTEAAALMPSLKSVWLAIHVTVATISVAVFTIGFSLGVLSLAQEQWPGRGFLARLPGAGALERLTYAAHVVAFPLWTFTVIAGAIWARQAWGSYWNWDPKEVWSFVIWVAYAAYLHARATTGWKRRSATLIALAGFACILINYAVVNVFFIGQHSYSGL